MKEVDLILGRFADASVDGMHEHDLSALEAFLDEPDPQILAWVTGEEPAPSGLSNPIVLQLIAFHDAR